MQHLSQKGCIDIVNKLWWLKKHYLCHSVSNVCATVSNYKLHLSELSKLNQASAPEPSVIKLTLYASHVAHTSVAEY